MPLYNFRCRACSAQFELLIWRALQPVCPECSYDDLERLPGLTAPQGMSKSIIANTRRAAAKEGHFSNYSAAKKAKPLKRVHLKHVRSGNTIH